MKVRISDHFTFGRLLRFTIPAITMMIFTSLYNVVDGYFVSNYAGKEALSAVNLAFPFAMLLAAPGFMVGAGGSALVAKTLGEGDQKRAKEIFSLFIWFALGLGISTSVAGYFLMPWAIQIMGGSGELLVQSTLYGRILMISSPFFTLQLAFENLFSTAGRPQTGLLVTVGAGLTNMVLDLLFVGVWGWGLVGAAVATVCAECVSGITALIYFLRPNPSTLRVVRTHWDSRAIRRGCLNGISELLSQISSSLIGMLFNAQLMRIAGEDGVAAYGVLMYVSFIFVATFLGYAVGVNPIVGYNYGAGNHKELHNVLKKSLILILAFGATLTALAEIGGESITRFFVGYDEGLVDMTTRGFEIYSLMYLFCGFPIFASSFFTGLNNGIVSACISVSRTLVFQVTCVLVLPSLFGVDGVWLSVAVAEVLATIVAFGFLGGCRKRYGY